MASVRKIAKEAGVSITTVSRVLNNHPNVSPEARKTVLAAANRAGYVPTVSKRSTNNLALVYTGESSFGSPFDGSLLFGLGQCMEEMGYDLMILDARRARNSNETYTQLFIRKGVRGVLLRTTSETRNVCETIANEKFPAVVIADRFENPNVSYVYSDSKESSREAVEHLISLGHKRIAICVNIVDDSDHADRLAGYQKAHAEHNLPIDPRLVMRIPATRPGGAQVLRRLVANTTDAATALFITDPATAAGAMRESRQLGVRVPEDLSIIGFDDGEMRFEVFPEMTAVCQNASLLGREACLALAGLIDQEGSHTPVQKSLRTWLEIHGSTAAPKS